jgi:hypothetical protein
MAFLRVINGQKFKNVNRVGPSVTYTRGRAEDYLVAQYSPCQNYVLILVYKYRQKS